MDDLIDYCVVDIETTIHNRHDDAVGNNKASPFYPSNRAVFVGYKPEQGLTSTFEPHVDDNEFHDIIFRHQMLVGHNIKFDLHYLRKHFPDHYYNWVINGGTVWDTQIVEYLLSGQSKQYATLDSLSEQYGGELKDDRIKEYWNNGIDTEDIPVDELLPYLEGDVENTENIFLQQIDKVMDMNMMTLVNVQMEALLALQEMEWNGMAFDVRGAASESITLQSELALAEADALTIMKSYLPDNADFKEITPHSPSQLSLVLFGGDVRCVFEEPTHDEDGLPIRFKSGAKKGQVKTKKVKRKVPIKGMGLVSPNPKGKTGYYPCDDATLAKLPIVTGSIVEAIVKARTLKKDISTYYDGYRQLTFSDGMIHPNYNQCSTFTGRLSCTQPNLQNATKK